MRYGQKVQFTHDGPIALTDQDKQFVEQTASRGDEGMYITELLKKTGTTSWILVQVEKDGQMLYAPVPAEWVEAVGP